MGSGTTKLEQAVRFAVKEHAGLFRDGNHPLPYATHVLEVMSLLRYVGGVEDEEMLIAAALHDSVEQSGTSPEKLRKKFGARVAGLVDEMTRKEKGFEALLKEVRLMSPEAKAIKLADRLSNSRAALTSRTGKDRDQYLEKTKRLLGAIPREINPGLWDALQDVICGA